MSNFNSKIYVNQENYSKFKSSNYIFETFLNAVTFKCLNELKIKINEKKQLNKIVDCESYITSCRKIINERLDNIFSKAFLIESRLFFNTSSSSYPKNKYKDFIEYTDSYNFFKDFFTNYKGAISIVNIITNQFLESQLSLLNDFNKDYQNIHKHFNIKKGKLKYIAETGGDVHSNGLQTLKVSINDSFIYYKPNADIGIYDHFQILLNWINEISSMSFTLPKTYGNDTHIWQEAIVPDHFINKFQVINYYKYQGALLCLFYLLGSTDMHYENIIAKINSPQLIDLETLFSNISIHSFDDDTESSTVLQTLMLPHFSPMNDFDFDISGITGGLDKKTKLNYDEIRNDKDGLFSIRKKKIVIKKKENIPLGNYGIVNDEEITKNVIEGFKYIYNIILKNRNYLQSPNSPIRKFQNDKCRYIYRSTETYYELLISMSHPKLLLDNQSKNKFLLKILDSPTLNYESLKKSEYEDLKSYCVPIFYFKIDSNDLYDGKGNKIKNFFDKSSLSSVINRLTIMNEEDLKKQIELIQLSMDSKTNVQKYVVFKYLNKNKLLYKVNRAINSKLIRNNNTLLSFTLSEPLSMRTGLKKRTIVPLQEDLYYGYSGIFLTQGIFHFLINKNNSLNLDYLYNTLEKFHNKKKIKNLKICGFSGIGSIIYAYMYIGFLSNDLKLIKKARFYLDEALDNANKDGFSIDYIGGISSFLLMLSNLIPRLDDITTNHIKKCIKEIEKKFIKKVFSETLKQKKYVTGLGHGLSGIAVGLASLYSITNNYENLNLIKTLTNMEDTYFDNNQSQWLDLRYQNNQLSKDYFCYGLPGIALARQIILKKTNLNCNYFICKKIISNNLKRILTIKNDSLCHGYFGNVIILNELLSKEVVSTYETKREFNIEDNIGLMTGYSGLLLFIMQQKLNEFANPLTFEIP